MKKNSLSILLLGLLLFSCSFGNENNNTPVIENTFNSSYEYTIRLNEEIYISFTDVVGEIKNNNKCFDVVKSKIKDIILRGFDDNGQLIEDASFRLIYYKETTTLENGIHTIGIKMYKSFKKLHINKINFTNGEKSFDLKTDISLKEELRNISYAKTLDSYYPDSRNWYNGGVFNYSKLRYDERNFEGFTKSYIYMFDGKRYSRNVDNIVLKNITFSDNVKEYILNIKYTIFDLNSDPLKFDYSNLDYHDFCKPISLNDITDENTDVLIVFETKELEERSFLGGDIIYDFTINDVDCISENMYLLFNYSIV